jgi:hypothetical protein
MIVGSMISWLAGTSTDGTPESRHPVQALSAMIIAIRGTIMVTYRTSFRTPCQTAGGSMTS